MLPSPVPICRYRLFLTLTLAFVAAESMVVVPACRADERVAALDASRDQLPQSWQPDIAGDADFQWLDFNGDATTIERQPDGLRHQRSATGGVREIRACVSIAGDFDIDVTYHDLQISDGKPTWHCGVGLSVQLDNSDRNRISVHRRRDRIEGQHVLALSHQKLGDRGQMTYVASNQIPDDSVSGRLRLTRRGETLTAIHQTIRGTEGRVIGEMKIHSGPVEVQGLRLITETGEGLDTSVTWSDLRVRADEIQTYVLPDDEGITAKTLQQLDANRETMADLNEDVNAETGGGLEWNLSSNATILPDDPGFRVRVESAGPRQSADIRKRGQVQGGFDIEAGLNVIHIDPALEPGKNNDITLLFFAQPADFARPADAEPLLAEREDPTMELTEATLSLRYQQDGTKELNCRTVGRNRLGQLVYRPVRSIPVDSIDRLRIAVDEQAIFFLYSLPDNDDMIVLGRVPMQQEFVVHGMGVTQNVHGAMGRSEVQWEFLRIHGDRK